MRKLNQHVLLVFAFLFVLAFSGHAQVPALAGSGSVALPKTAFDGNRGTFTPKWGNTYQVNLKSSLDKTVAARLCEGCGLDPEVVNLPYYEVMVPVAANERLEVAAVQEAGAKEENSPLYQEAAREAQLSRELEWYPARQVIAGEHFVKQGRHYQALRIYPIRVSPDGSRYREAQSISYTLRRVRNSAKRLSAASSKTYASSSVLSTGTWYKIGVTREGIYKIDYAWLQNNGINPSSINPRTLKIYGNGGAMLTQVAGEWPYDDLVENSVFVSGEGDDVFNPGDFLLFYGESPHGWKFSESENRYYHQHNLYSDTTFYFLSFGGANGKRIPTEASVTSGVTAQPQYTHKYAYKETDKFNALSSGRIWMGETFDLTTDQTFSFTAPNLFPDSMVDVVARVGARSNVVSNFEIFEGNSRLSSIRVPNINSNIYGSYYYRTNYMVNRFNGSAVSDGSIDIRLVYDKPLSTSVGYLDFIEVNYKQQLKLNGSDYFWFTATEGVGPGQVFEYRLQNGNDQYTIWDITDIRNVQRHAYSISGSNISFGARADSLKRFVAFNSSSHREPVSISRVSNQNLHGAGQADYLIITHPRFLGASQRLAEFHASHYGRTVSIATTHQVYNEFSSGRMDPTAIRDYIKMFYDRHLPNDEQPKYVLLFGDGSYDYKNRDGGDDKNYVPTYQSRKSQRPTESYTSDDYYGFLDDGEGYWGEKSSLEGGALDIMFWIEGDSAINTHMLDVGIGRLPVETSEEANYMVDKIINYVTNPSGFGSWRNNILLVADHKDTDGVIHISQSDSYTGAINNANPCIQLDKLYMDNYTMENTASGQRFPDGKSALLKALNEGSLLVNYTGHGGEVGWSNASILDVSDINTINNGTRLPAYVTATCEFGRWDDPSIRSGAELVFLKRDGGSIAMFTTVRVVFSGPNYVLNSNFYRNLFVYDSTAMRMPAMGDVFRNTKNASWLGGINNRNFTMMGDPGVVLAYPELSAVITSINGSAVVDTVVDTLAALSLVTVEGEIRDDQGNFISTYNGDMSAVVFDKPSKFVTKRAPFTFFWQKNKVFNGSTSVENGRFRFQFVVPIDVSYEDGNGKISLYFKNPSQDGAGCIPDVYIGGTDSSTISDDVGPALDLYMNDEKFTEGGLVGPDPTMIAKVFDDNGLNTVGAGIGHELTAVLNGDESEVIILNDYYTADKNSYQQGTIRYPFEALPDGEHQLRVKVWDVANNSTEATVGFVVASDASIALGHVLNYPNPFTTNTKFYIEHNQNGQLLDVQVKIYTVSGRMVKSLRESFFSEGNLYCDMEWDGLDEFGDPLGRGVYVYHVAVKNITTGERATKFEKLVVLR